MSAKKQMLERLRKGIIFPPLEMCLVKADTKGVDAVVEVRWKGRAAKCAVEIKSDSRPRIIRDAIQQAKVMAERAKLSPLILVPYLNEEQLVELGQQDVSGVDLCGNGIVMIPGKFAVYRTGGRNRFPASASIKNIYRKNTSMVPRVFLARPSYRTVREIQAEVEKRRVPLQRSPVSMALSTVSKALKSMEDDLIVTRSSGDIRLTQPEKLLDNLARNFVLERKAATIRRKVSLGSTALRDFLANTSRKLKLPIVATGLSSVSRYAVMERIDVVSIYCTDAAALVAGIPGSSTDRFPNLEVTETADELLFFDAREEAGFRWASPVQTFLELTAGDKRDVETADQVKELILGSLTKP